ncbi:MAG TPA: septal ring lytic transglycosylase RlpA family protein [Candidatus Binataceae bacterium]|nr:septal ring lytic transglycosylase RlpA family protein [Candidatus Binataceae bacterium]
MPLTALLLAGFALSACGSKRHAASAAPPAPQIRVGETGLASWYGHPYHGRAAANGEIYDMEKLTAAHRTLPFGTWVRVTNLTNNRSVEVRIIDRGPFVEGRVIDLSHAAAEAIGSVGAGLAQVRLDILSTPVSSVAENWFTVQAGAFAEKERAERLRSLMEREFGNARLVLRPGTPALWRVLVGRERNEPAATALAARVRNKSGTAFVVRLDQPAALAEVPVPSSSQQ